MKLTTRERLILATLIATYAYPRDYQYIHDETGYLHRLFDAMPSGYDLDDCARAVAVLAHLRKPIMRSLRFS